MLFYVPPLGPVLAKVENGVYDNIASEARLGPLMSSLERSRIPLRYMASLLSGGNEEIIRDVYKKLVAVRVYMRSKKVKDIPAEEVQRALSSKARPRAAEVEAIWRLTSMPTFEERFVVPPMERETAVDALFPCSIRSRTTIRFAKARSVSASTPIRREDHNPLFASQSARRRSSYICSMLDPASRSYPARNGGMDIGCFH